MGDLSDALSKINLNSKNGGKLTTKKITQPKKAHETDDDIAILTMILPGEKFECCLKNECMLGNSFESSLGMDKMHCNAKF